MDGNDDCTHHFLYVYFRPSVKSKAAFLQHTSCKEDTGRKMNKEKQKEKKKTTSFATSFRAIVTGFWCHHQPWHFIHTEHLWAHHICFSTQRIFKCFPGNCFNTICLLGNPVPTNAMPLSLFLGLLILAYKNPVARFSICSYPGTDLSLHVKREG